MGIIRVEFYRNEWTDEVLHLSKVFEKEWRLRKEFEKEWLWQGKLGPTETFYRIWEMP